MIKRLLTSAIFFFAFLICNAQIVAPVQYDTLAIEEMQYHYESIRPENWPFKYVVRTAQSFIFGDHEFCISESNELFPGRVRFFMISDGEKLDELSTEEKDGIIEINYAGYILKCRKPNDPDGASVYYKVSKAIGSLQERSIVGELPVPSNLINQGGTIVVSIGVDNYGNVVKAQPGADGTTVTNKELWNAARNAAMRARFNQSAEAPALQEGTINYIYTAQDIDNLLDDEPISMLEQKPSFQGGDANVFAQWVNERLVYPKEAKENGIQGRITLQYTIDVDGTVTNVKVLRGVHSLLDNEAVRVVKQSPKWDPGMVNGEPVKVTYTFPVIFQLN